MALLAAVVVPLSLRADEKRFDFSNAETNQPPPDCTSVVAGEGKPGDWRVLLDEAPLEALPFSPTQNPVARKSVVGQIAQDKTDEHFPMLLLGNDTYGDFTFTTRFKIVDGLEEQMAGVAFRVQDEKNFYYVRASALGGSLYFFIVKNGQRSPPIGNKIPFEKGVWHELSVQCTSTNIVIGLDGKEALPVMGDATFAGGKLALLTKSDAVSYFTDIKVDYKSKDPLAQLLVRDVMKEYSKLAGLKIYAKDPKSGETRLVASDDEKEIGQLGEASDTDVIKRGVSYYLKKKDVVVVTMPLRDRNGDPMAAVRVLMKPNFGQTEDNARVRATPVIRTMQDRVAGARSLTD